MITWLLSLVSGPSIRLILFIVLVLGSAAVGASLMADVKNGQINALKAEQAAANSRASQEALYRLIAERRRGDALATQVAAAESARQIQSEEKANAVRRLTVGRPCLDGVVVRLLNEPAGIKPAAVPPPTGEPAGPNAGFATDTDVGLWAASARRHYDTCRGRLQAVAEFFPEEVTP